MEIASSLIETGVDKLVNLVKERGRIALADAAKELGVSATVIQEWVDFLEEEGIISVEYKMTKPYLVERKLTKKEVEVNAPIFLDSFYSGLEKGIHPYPSGPRELSHGSCHADWNAPLVWLCCEHGC